MNLSTYFNHHTTLSRKTVFLVILSTLSGLLTLHAQHPVKINATLYHGQNDNITDHLEKEKALKEKLMRLFGYQRYEKLGKSQADLKSSMPQKLTPCKKFYLNLMDSSKRKNAYMFEIIHEEKSLFQGEFVPKPKVPLIIRGPQYGNGVLILVLQGEER